MSSEAYIKQLKSESAQFRALLPDKIWLMVIRKLLEDCEGEGERSGNFLRLINASPYFRELKMEDRAGMLLPQVLQILNNLSFFLNND